MPVREILTQSKDESGIHVRGEETSLKAGRSSACSVCGTEMVILRITPILFGGKFEVLSLACKKCGSTKELRISAVDPNSI
jgi:hypothetical protein